MINIARINSEGLTGNDIYILVEEDVVKEPSARPDSKRTRLLSELALDESKCLGAVLVDVLLVRVGIVAVAAVRVSSVAV
jgi:hypothetical protein